MAEHDPSRRGKSPAWSMYAKDWLSSEDVTRMPPQAEGLYIRLLNLSWDNEGLPTEPEAVKELAGLKYARCWKTAWPPVRRKFVERNGRLVNLRQEKEREKQRMRAKQAQAAADARWEEERRLASIKDASVYADASPPHGSEHMRTSAGPGAPPQSLAVASAVADASALPKSTAAAAPGARPLDYATRCCLAVNHVLDQQLASTFVSLVPNVERPTAAAWEAAGIPIELAETTLAELAGRFPNARGRQPKSLGYFTAALHEAHAKGQGQRSGGFLSPGDHARAEADRMEREAAK